MKLMIIPKAVKVCNGLQQKWIKKGGSIMRSFRNLGWNCTCDVGFGWLLNLCRWHLILRFLLLFLILNSSKINIKLINYNICTHHFL